MGSGNTGIGSGGNGAYAGPMTVTSQGGTIYTLALADAQSEIEFTSGSTVTVTVPVNASVNFPVGTVIVLRQIAAGAVTVAAQAGVTINGPSTTQGKNGTLTLLQGSTNVWYTSASYAAAQTPQLPVGKWAQMSGSDNNATGFSLDVEYCFPLVLPGSGVLDQIALQIFGAGDAGSVIRIGVREDNAGVPSSAVVGETTVAATATGVVAAIGLSIPYGQANSAVVWLSLVWQGGTAVSPTIGSSYTHYGFFNQGFISDLSAFPAPRGWNVANFGQTGVTGTLAAAGVGLLNADNHNLFFNGQSGAVPLVWVHRSA